jgi:hypothetical protein
MSDNIFTRLPPRAAELGPAVAHYRDRPGASLFRTALGVLTRLALGLAAVWLGVSHFAARDEDAGAGPVAFLILGMVVGTICCVSAVGLVALTLARRRGGNTRGVIHCPGGLVCVLPDKCVVAPWDEIDTIWDGGRRFRVRGGAEVTLPDTFEGLATLAELVYRETFQRLSICASAMILGGRSVEFGPITLTRDEIAVGDRRVAWPDVAAMLPAWGRLRVLRKGQRLPALDVPLAEVPHQHALWALAERLREGGFGSIVIGPQPSPEWTTDDTDGTD